MNLRKLYDHLDQNARRVLRSTADTAARDGRGRITVELFLLMLLRDRSVGAEVMRALDDVRGRVPSIADQRARAALSRGIHRVPAACPLLAAG